MKILMLSWRDMKHPQKGGAEIVTDIYLSHLANNKNNEVVLFSSEYKDCKKQELYNNYKILRKGNQLTCHYHALAYAVKNQKDFDIIIDQVNTIPFFTPLFIKKQKRIAFFHQLCKNVWFYEKSLPVAIIGYLTESLYLKLYSNTKTLTISDSSKQDLIKYCWNKQENIKVLECQIDFKPIYKSQEKENHLIFVGRLTKSKRVHDCIKAMNLIENKNTKLYIVGNGSQSYKNYLNKLTNKLNLKDRVIFTGSISNQERNNLMQKALAILVTSVREGWGLIVTEANANGTIAITYDIEGLRDANSNKAGIITKQNNPKSLAESIDSIINNPELRKQKENYAIEYAIEHSNWNKQCKELEKWIAL